MWECCWDKRIARAKWGIMKDSSSGESGSLGYRGRRGREPEPDLDVVACGFAFAAGHWVKIISIL